MYRACVYPSTCLCVCMATNPILEFLRGGRSDAPTFRSGHDAILWIKGQKVQASHTVNDLDRKA